MSAAVPGAAAPPDLGLRLAPGVLVRDGGRLLVGGAPTRLIRLSDAGAAMLARWRTGAPAGPQASAQALARRLLDSGLLLPDPPPGPTADLAVVVPTHGRADELARCLRSVALGAPDAALMVVDDGSPNAGAIATLAAEHGAALVRHDRPRGPSAARNRGLAEAQAPLVAFVDSDVVVPPGCLARLAGHFADVTVAAVAPRVLALETEGGAILTYEAAHSALDMGPVPSRVAPGAPVSYLPSATLVVRRAAIERDFDEALHIGEDVDLVWRLAGAGWAVQYDPSVHVLHDHRGTAAAFVRRRFAYASSTGLLAARHPRALPAVRADGATAVVALALAGRPLVAAAAAGRVAWRTRAVLVPRAERPNALTATLTARTMASAARSVAHAARRPWWPALALTAARRPRAGLLLAGALAAGLLEERPRTPAHAALCIADDLISGAGTWWSCLRCRTVAPLLPGRGVEPSTARRSVATRPAQVQDRHEHGADDEAEHR
jgi:mycofactocin system glycosyltransferase